MKWNKKGLIFAPDHNYDWMVSHASIPVVEEIRPEVLRIYFGTRDGNGRSHTSYIEVEAAEPGNIRYIHDRPILLSGKAGTFDDSGIMPSWIINHEGKKYLYYIGWNVRVSVPYHLSIGLAVSEDGGKEFHKISAGPLLDRSLEEPFFNTAPCVLREDDRWRMWYISCTGWDTTSERPEPRYYVKHADSTDGISWRKTGHVCIGYDEKTGAIGRPCVFKDSRGYKMFYSYRSVHDYRTDPTQSYRLGYAESVEGLTWTRLDHQVGIERSASGWDSVMMEYCYFHRYDGRSYLFYNGNGFGKTGFGYAVLDDTLQPQPDRET
jgi:hypothetical protein